MKQVRLSNQHVWLFISRLQPAHKWHLSAIEQSIAQGITHILLWIWSADKEMTQDNPFSYKQRELIATALIEEIQKKYPDITISVHPIIDFGNNEQWKNYVETSLPEFDTIVTWNPIVKELLWKNRQVFTPNHTDIPYRGTHIRNQIMNEDRENIKKSVPELVIDQLRAIDAPRIMKTINELQPQPVRLATDIITLHEWKYVLIKRKHAPFGIALPWWMLDNGERLHECAKREWGEELFKEDDLKKNIQITSEQPLRINDKPNRDPRWRVISFIYEWVIKGWTLHASDDAAELLFVDPADIESIPDSQFAFLDHKESLLRHRDW